MMLNTLREIQAFLNRNNDFGESIIESISWENLLTTVSISMSVPRFSTVKPIQFEHFIFKFHIIQSFNFIGGITKHQIQNLDKVNWGLNEISRIILDHDSYELVDYMNYKTQFFRAQLKWEHGNKRYIEIIFSKLEVHSKPVKLTK